MKAMKNLIYLLFALAFLTLGCEREVKPYENTAVFATADDMVADAQTRITEVDATQLKQIFDSEPFVLIDVRSEGEYGGGFIPGAVNIPRGSLEFRVARKDIWDKAEMYVPEKDQLIIVYCKAGNRSALAAETLQRMGYTNVKSLAGGWKAWHESYPDLSDHKESAGGHAVAEEGGC